MYAELKSHPSAAPANAGIDINAIHAAGPLPNPAQTGGSMNARSPTPREQQVLDIFNRHVTAFNAGDLNAVLSDFHEHAVVITPEGVFEGTDQIRSFYGGLLEEFGTIGRGDSPGFSFDALHASDDTLFFTWHAESMHHIFPFGADTCICRGDKFERQSIAFSPPRPRNETTSE